MTHPARHRDHDVARKRAVRLASLTAIVVTFAIVLGGVAVYRHLNGNINAIDTSGLLGDNRPEKVKDNSQPLEPLNILLLGSDTRKGQSGHIGGDTPGLSDTTILLHVSADRQHAYGVSLPRDAMVERPDCTKTDGTVVPGGLAMFNTAYAVAGPACTQKTVEQLTGIRIDHFVVVEFDGFRNMVNALGGIQICVPEAVHDTIGHIDLPAGTYEANGDQALDYVRVRHALSNNGDIGRMKRQQVFLASMANKAISAGTLANPVKLYNFLDAATQSLSTDPGLASIKDLGTLANQLRNIGLKNIKFITVPWETYQPDHNRLVWAPEAKRLWKRIKNDEDLSPGLAKNVTTAADRPSGGSSQAPGGNKSQSPSPGGGSTSSTSPTPTQEAKAAEAKEFGLCG